MSRQPMITTVNRKYDIILNKDIGRLVCVKERNGFLDVPNGIKVAGTKDKLIDARCSHHDHFLNIIIDRYATEAKSVQLIVNDTY